MMPIRQVSIWVDSQSDQLIVGDCYIVETTNTVEFVGMLRSTNYGADGQFWFTSLSEIGEFFLDAHSQIKDMLHLPNRETTNYWVKELQSR